MNIICTVRRVEKQNSSTVLHLYLSQTISAWTISEVLYSQFNLVLIFMTACQHPAIVKGLVMMYGAYHCCSYEKLQHEQGMQWDLWLIIGLKPKLRMSLLAMTSCLG